MLSAAERKGAAEALLAAARDHAVIPPISVTYPAAEVEDAYRISQAVAEAKLQAGAILKGHKIGLTSRPMQEAAGINEPNCGLGRFNPDGSLDGSFGGTGVVTQPLAGPTQDTAPAVTAGPGGRFGVVYQRFAAESPYASQRVFLRSVSPK